MGNFGGLCRFRPIFYATWSLSRFSSNPIETMKNLSLFPPNESRSHCGALRALWYQSGLCGVVALLFIPLVSAMAASDHGPAFRAEGKLTAEWRMGLPDQETEEFVFKVLRDKQEVLIELSPVSAKSRAVYYTDGTEVIEGRIYDLNREGSKVSTGFKDGKLITVTNETPSKPLNDAHVHVARAPLPAFGVGLPFWLAFAADDFFAHASRDRLEDLNGRRRFRESSPPKLKAKWQQIEQWPFSIVQFENYVNSGFTNRSYRVVSWLEHEGLRFPEKFVHIKFKENGTPAVRMESRVERISVGQPIGSIDFNLPKRTLVNDHRFYEATPPLPSFQYLITNGVIPTPKQAEQRPEYHNQLASSPHNPNSRVRFSWHIPFLALFLVPVIYLVRQALKFRQ